MIETETFVGVAKLFTGRRSFFVNNVCSSASNRDSGLGLVQFIASTVEMESKQYKVWYVIGGNTN